MDNVVVRVSENSFLRNSFHVIRFILMLHAQMLHNYMLQVHIIVHASKLHYYV